MAGGDIKGTRPTRSVVDILISTIRSQAEATLVLERLLADRADEFTIARARRIVLDTALTAQSTADGAERLQRAALAGLPPSLTVANTDHPSPPDEPPPQAA